MHRHHHHHGAHAPGLAAPERACQDPADLAPLGAAGAAPAGVDPGSDEPAELGSVGGSKGQGSANSRDCADTSADRKQVATLQARLALGGIEAHQIHGGAWLLRHARGADIGVVHGAGALAAAVSGFEAARDDVRELVRRMRTRGAA